MRKKIIEFLVKKFLNHKKLLAQKLLHLLNLMYPKTKLEKAT